MKPEIDLITNLECRALFELERAQEFCISSQVADFLLSARVPWEALGKKLTSFLEELVASIPASQRIRGQVSPHAVIENPEMVVIEEGAIVEPHTFISGPTYICSGAAVRQGAYVRGSVYAAKGAVIGHTTEAKGSILLANAKAAHFAYVGDSILGVDCNLGAGTKLANLRFDHGLVPVTLDGQRIDTNLKKFGAILGNRAQTGCNSVTNPGTILLPGAFLLPNSTGTGVVKRGLRGQR